MNDTSPDPWKNCARIKYVTCSGVMNCTLRELRSVLSVRARNVLNRAGVETVDAVRVLLTEQLDGSVPLMKVKGCGIVTVNEIRKALEMRHIVTVAALSDTYLRTVTATLAKYGYKVVKMTAKEAKS